MTTLTFASFIEHTSDATFRAWGSEFSTKLALVGLTNTSDTGQINWSTVSRPSSSLAAGYEIWRFADSSIYMKIEYGTGGNGSSIPKMWVTVGTGSNGSGTITGQTSTRKAFTVDNGLTSTDTSYTSYMCLTADAFFVVWKRLSYNGSYPFGVLCIGKTVDSAGDASSVGFGVFVGPQTAGGSPSLQSVRTLATAVTFASSNFFCQIVGDVTSSLVGADIQVYACWCNMPQVLPFPWVVGYILSEITATNEFDVAMVGNESHTYLAAGQINTNSVGFSGQNLTTYGYGFIYE